MNNCRHCWFRKEKPCCLRFALIAGDAPLISILHHLRLTPAPLAFLLSEHSVVPLPLIDLPSTIPFSPAYSKPCSHYDRYFVCGPVFWRLNPAQRTLPEYCLYLASSTNKSPSLSATPPCTNVMAKA
ncbi:hypothetical protein CBL_03468 [Carabus blaptoides fortunei]